MSLVAPDIDHYRDWLGRINYREVNNTFTYDKKSYELLDEVYEYIEKIAPINKYGVRKLWVCVDRGRLEDFQDTDDIGPDGVAESIEELERWWLDTYPKDTVWYELCFVYDKDNDYKAITLNHRHVIDIDKTKEKGWEHDISDFALWILEVVKDCYKQLKNGVYNERVNKELPYDLRTGTITRKDLYTILPEWREESFKNLSESEIEEFNYYISKMPDKDSMPRITEFTANEFYKCCSLGYIENNYDIGEMKPKEQYYRFADGRDNGLRDIEGDSVEAFIKWYHGDHFGGHPWEVCAGGNSTHVDLYVHHNDNGFLLSVAGASETRCVEAIKFFLALKRAGYPVYIHDSAELVSRFNGTEKIGIVPKGVYPRYCEGRFADDKVIDFMNLPYEKSDEVAALCIWQPLQEIRLIDRKQTYDNTI